MPRSTPHATITFSLAALLASVAGCRPMPGPQPPRSVNQTKSVHPLDPPTDYRLVGVVRSVEPSQGRVTIRHEEIPGFMKAMTMPFTLKDPKDLDDVRPGDEVEALLRVERYENEVKDYWLHDLVVSKPAPAQSLSLNLAGGKSEVGPAARVLAPGDPVPDFAMTDQDGKALRLSDLRGRVVALTFIFTGCPLPDFCPRMDRKFSEAADRLRAAPERARQARLLSVSFDPEHDTPAVLKAHARGLGAEPPLWTFAVAPHAELAKVAAPLGLAYGPGRDGMIHNLVIAVIDPGGRLVRLETGEAARSWDTAGLLKAMYSRLPGATE